MDELTQIYTFINVVEAQSFSAAARQQSVSISTVARQVKLLEDQLGVRLLNRSTRSLSLTEPGRLFHERVCAISNDLNKAKSEVKSFQKDVRGVLRVALRVSTGTTIVVPALPAFLEQYPDLSVEVSLTDERQDLVANDVDVAVWMGDMPDSEFVARRLSPSQRVVCASPKYIARHGAPQSPNDLRRHNCILFAARSYGNVWVFSRNGQREDVEVRGNLWSENGLVLLSAAQAGLGIVVVHERTVRPLILQGHLTRVLDDYTVKPRVEEAELHAVYPSGRGLSRNVRVFVDFLVELFR